MACRKIRGNPMKTNQITMGALTGRHGKGGVSC